jgi:NAD(P)H dehydrogenase (quinone)
MFSSIIGESKMIVVTGANGHLGKAIIESLVQRFPPEQIVASVRNPVKASGLAARGIEVRAADFSNASSLKAAFANADQVLVVSADKLGEEALQLHRTAIEAAREAGVDRILYTSHMGARIGSPFPPADQHAGTEADLAASGLAYTSLRHGFYAESCLYMIGDALRTGELRVPEDGPVSWTARDDLAHADAAILAKAGQWDGPTPPLTASEALTMAQIAVLASEVTGREVRHVTVPDAEWMQAKVAAGMPAIFAEMLVGTFRAARRGDFAATDPTLEMLLGRPPQAFREVLAASRI